MQITNKKWSNTMQQSTYKDILEQYKYLLEENYDVVKMYLINYLKSKIIFNERNYDFIS